MTTPAALLLAQNVERRPGESVCYREARLDLCEDGNSLLLRRYWEHYDGTHQTIWLERCYRVRLDELTRWMMTHGERQVDFCIRDQSC